MKYIQNLTKMKNNVQLEYNDPDGDLHFGKPSRATIIFRAETVDGLTNSILHTGITPVDDKVFDALMQERNFTYAIGDKVRWLVVYDTLPEFAQTPNDVMVQLREENVQLRQKIAEYEAGSGGISEAEFVSLKTELDTVKEELASAKAANETMLAELNGALQDRDSAKAANTALVLTKESIVALPKEVFDALEANVSAVKNGV